MTPTLANMKSSRIHTHVTREGNKLISEARGQPRSEMFPESETTFFVKDADAQFTFVKDSQETEAMATA